MIRHASVTFVLVQALLLLAVANSALAQEEPTAKAPLPPPLTNTPSESRPPQIKPEPSGLTTRPDRPKAIAPAIGLDRSNTLSPQKRPPRVASAAKDRAAASAEHRGTPSRTGDSAGKRLSHRLSRRTHASTGNRGHHQQPIARHEVGTFSAPAQYPAPRIESATITPPAEPPRAPIPYYPDYRAGPPAYGYLAPYSYPWAPPGSRLFR
jgi:hypothetical protein